MSDKQQVELEELIFTLNWEDPAADLEALKIQPGENILTITSGCCNTLEFLLQDPAKIYAVDINAAQTHVMALKTTAIKYLDYPEFATLMGLQNNGNRQAIYQKLKGHLTEGANRFWDQNTEIIDMGLLMNGRYEKFVQMAGKALRFIQGKRIIHRLFDSENLEQQEAYFNKTFNTWRFRMIFKLLFNKRMLAKKGLNAEYFHFDDGSSSFAESFFRRTRNVLTNIPVQGNYFLALYLLGDYRTPDEIPEYLKETHFETLKSRVDRIENITLDANDFLKQAENNSIDGYAMSNICELKSEQDTELMFSEIVRTAKPGARVIFRNLMIPRDVPESLESKIVKDQGLSKKLQLSDSSCVYGQVAAYNIP